MRFSEALTEVFDGFPMTRMGWNGKGMFIEAQYPDKRSKMTVPYLYLNTVTADKVPWLPSQSDIFADDWVHVTVAGTIITPSGSASTVQ